MRQTFLYNNLMYAAAGNYHRTEIRENVERFVHEKIFRATRDENDHFLDLRHDAASRPWRAIQGEARLVELYKIPYYEDYGRHRPGWRHHSNIDELSHWLIALMNEGKYTASRSCRRMY